MSVLSADVAAPPRRDLPPPVARGGSLPAVLVVAVALLLSLSLVAGWLGVSPWSTRWAAALALGACVGGAVLLLRPAGRGERGGSHPGGVLLALPAASVVAVGIVGAVRPPGAGIEWFLGGDHTRHAVYVADTWWQGSLTYALDGYPRGWHSALATVWAATGRAGLDADGVLSLVTVMAAASLLLSAALSLATAHLALAVAVRTGLTERVAVAVGVVAGALTLLNFALANYQALGYENSLLAAVVLAVCAREVLVRPGSRASLVVCAAGTLVTAHAWQLLLPVVALPALWCAYRALRSGGPPRRLAVVLMSVVVVLGAPGVLAVVTGVGIDHAAEAGPDSPVPVPLLVAGLVAAIAAAWRRRRDPAVVVVAAATVTPAVLAVALAVGLGVDLLHYYPSKLLWQSAVLGVVWVVAAAGHAAALAGARAAPVRVLAGAASVVVTTYCLLLPWGSQVGAWSSTDGYRVVAAVTTPGAEEAVVVWLEDTPTTDSATRSLLDVLRVDRTRDRAPQARLSVDEECALLDVASRPVVLSTAGESEVRARYACVDGPVVTGVETP